MQKIEHLFKKKTTREAVLISLIISVLLMAIEALKWLTSRFVSWIATNILGITDVIIVERWAYAISFCLAVFVLLYYIYIIPSDIENDLPN